MGCGIGQEGEYARSLTLTRNQKLLRQLRSDWVLTNQVDGMGDPVAYDDSSVELCELPCVFEPQYATVLLNDPRLLDVFRSDSSSLISFGLTTAVNSGRYPDTTPASF